MIGAPSRQARRRNNAPRTCRQRQIRAASRCSRDDPPPRAVQYSWQFRIAEAKRQIKLFPAEWLRPVKSSGMTTASKTRGFGAGCAFAVWAIVVIAAAFAGVWMGYGGRQFVLALTVAALLFAFELFLAVPSLLNRVQRTLGSAASLAALWPLGAVLVYSLFVSGNVRSV